MRAPCQGCQDRTVTPNCHGTCEQYQLYVEERERIREMMTREHEERYIRIIGAKRVREEAYRRRRK